MEVPSRIWFKKSEGVVLGRIPPNADEKLTDSEKLEQFYVLKQNRWAQKMAEKRTPYKVEKSPKATENSIERQNWKKVGQLRDFAILAATGGLRVLFNLISFFWVQHGPA